MKNRDNFIDLMEEIDVNHLEEHIRNNTDTKAKLKKRYITAAGMYVAACVAVLVLIPVIMNFTTDKSPTDPPGKAPMTTEPAQTDPITDKTVDEYFADKKLYKVLDAAGVKREDVDFLKVDELQIVDGDVYYPFDGIYKNTDSTPIYTRNNPNMKYPIEYFTVTGDYIICVVDEDPNKVEQDLYCYNMKTGEETLVCSDDIYRYDVHDGKVVYLTADSINNIKAVKVYTYDPEANKSTFVCDLPDTHHYLGNICYNGSELVLTTDARVSDVGRVSALNMKTGELSNIFPSEHRAKLAITATDRGFYLAYERAKLDETGNLVGVGRVFEDGQLKLVEDNGVWFIKSGEEPVKVSDTYYNELYNVNGILVGVNGDEVSVIKEDSKAIDEFFKDTKLYKVLNTAGIRRADVDFLMVDDHMIVDGDVYYRNDNKIYRNTEDQPILSEELLPIDEFSVGNGYVFYTIIPNADVEPTMHHLYCYNMDTKERSSICLDTILYFGITDGELLYATDDPEDRKSFDLYSYDPASGKSSHVTKVTAEGDVESVVYCDRNTAVIYHQRTGKGTCFSVYNISKDKWDKQSTNNDNIRIVPVVADSGVYYLNEWVGSDYGGFGSVAKRFQGVWYIDFETTESTRIAGALYDEMYIVNGILVGVNGDEATVIVDESGE